MAKNDDESPTAAEWLALTPEGRRRVVERLPLELTHEELAAEEGEGDEHREGCNDSVDALRTYYRRIGRRAYVSSNLMVFYPRERRFAPDLLVVFDVEAHRRRRWLVVDEGRGLDFALEIVDEGDRGKDLRENVARYARLGIPEYAVFDVRHARLHAFRLPSAAANEYESVELDAGRFHSRVLGLDLRVEGARVRFLAGTAALPASAELLERIEREMGELHARLDAEARAREAEVRARLAESRAREAEARAREVSEAEVARLRAELEELKRKA